MKKLLIVMVLGASAVAASAQSLQPRRTLGGRLQRQKMLAKAVQQQETVDGFTWSYRVSNGEAIIMKLEKGHESCAVSPTPKGHFTIPSTLGGVKVTGIGGYAFVFCSEMTSVTLPDAVKEIGGSAFLACGLTSVKIPEGVTGIGNQAFYGCGKLTSVTIPASVESIGWGVFGWCPQLKQINLADGNQRFTVVDGVLYTKDLSELIMCPNTLTSVKIPSKVSKIGMMSFEGCEGLVSLTIPEGVTNIGEQAFRGCRELASVTMLGERPASLNNIFDRCGKLKAIHVPAKCKSWAGMKKWCGISLVFDGKRLNQQKKVCEEKANVNSGTSKRGVKELTFGADDGLPCELTMVELPGDEKVAAFAIGKYEITQEQYEKVMGTNPSKVKGAKLPVNNVTYDEAKKFCERLNGLIKRQDLKWTLPDEKQWQYAAKGGEKFKFAGSDDINEVAWTMENSGGKVQPVGGKKPNGFGLYDMCGNVCEWGHFVGRSFGVVFAGPSVHVDTVKERKIRVGGRRRSGHIMDKGFRIVAVNKSNGKSKQTSVTNAVAEKLQGCKFLVNEQVKGNAKFYLCLFSASWCGPCRREMPRIAKTYAEMLKDDPDIELIHFSRDQNDEKAMAWAKEHDVKFPVVKPSGGNPLDLHSRGIPHLFIVKADGTVLEEGHPMRIFNAEKFRELKGGSPAAAAKVREGDGSVAASASRQCAGKLPSQFMPTKGLLASFDYDGGKETNTGYGEVRRENDHVAFVEGAADYDGVYKYSSRGGRFKRGDRFEEDYVIPELNFDRFTVACSFRSAHTNNWGQFFRIGQTCYSILEVGLSRGKVSVYGGKLRNLSAPYVDGEWNWLVVSVDVPKREAWLSVNGCAPVSTSLPEDFFWFVPSDRVSGDKFRRLTFGNWQCGERYCGQVDDLMVYDRALGREEFAKVCKRTDKAKDRAVASFEKPAPAKLPELRDDRWLFMPHDEQSVYWNGTIRTKNVTLKVRREVDGLCVEPPGGIVDSVLDLTLPVVDASGQPLSIVGIGSECDPYCIRARKATMSEVRLPDTLKTIRKNAFAGCMKLESIVIPENVREIGSFAFDDCGNLTKLEIRSKSVVVAKDAFSGSTPVGTDLPQKDWTTGPLTKEIKGDPKFEYAKEGRMTEPLFSFSYGDILFGRKYGDVGGWGSTKMKGHEAWGEFDLRFVKLGTDQLAGVTLKWRKKEDSEGSVDAAKTVAKELVALIEAKVKGKVDPPLYLPESEWPEYGGKGNYYADYGKLKPIGSSQTEVNGYMVKVDVYGGTKDANVAVVVTIIDNYMFKAWGMSPKI